MLVAKSGEIAICAFAAGEATATRVGIFRIFDAPDDVEVVRQAIDPVRGLARRWPGSCRRP